MGGDYNSGSSIVTGSVVSAPATPASTQTIINVSGTGTGASADSYTVTSGKTLYIYGFVGYNTGAAWQAYLYANDGTTRRCVISNLTNTGAGISSTSPIAVYTSAQVVKVTVTTSALFNWWGVEQ